jgi:hypothetical protein
MLEIRYSGNADVDLRASTVELVNLRDSVLELIESDLTGIRFDADETIDPKPWECLAKGLEVFRQDGAVCVSIRDNLLRVQGSDDNLRAFVSYFPTDETAQSDSHTHFEYYEGNSFIRPDSVPLVIGVR